MNITTIKIDGSNLSSPWLNSKTQIKNFDMAISKMTKPMGLLCPKTKNLQYFINKNKSK